MAHTKPAKRLRCRLGIHKPVLRSDADARWYECEHCEKFCPNVTSANRYPPGGTGDDGGGGA